MADLSPRRSDVIFTLMRGLSGAELGSDILGLHLEKSTTIDDTRKMGARHGFQLDSDTRFDIESVPTCYVRLLPSQGAASVMRELLVSEPAVITINFNYSVPAAHMP